MNTLLEVTLSNIVMAAILAVPAALAGWWGRRPALTHGLWLLVLLKLVTPPIFWVPVALAEAAPPPPLPAVPAPMAVPVPLEPAAPPEPPREQPAVALQEPEALVAPVEPELPEAVEPAVAPVPELPADARDGWTAWLLLPWLAGSVSWLLLAARRLDRFRRLLRFAQPASAELQAEAHALAKEMGVRCPQVLMLPGAVSPMLWAVGRAPRLLMPAELLGRLQPGQRATLLAHELAHWRRGDHRVRWLEVLVLALYWWCPLAWWACRQLHQAEEECCDAWVVAVLPDAARAYALALVETIDFLSGAPTALPPVASGVGHVRLLQRRLTMILRGTTPQSLTRLGLLALTGLGLLLLPFVPGLAQQPAPKTPEELLRAEAVRLLQQLQQAQNQQDPVVRDRENVLAEKRTQLENQKAELELRLKQLHDALQFLQQAQAKPASGAPPVTASPPAIVKTPQGNWSIQVGSVGGKSASSIEQRLDQLEKKLDTLLWEITNLRRDMNRGPGAPGFPAGMVPPGGFSPYKPGSNVVPHPPGGGAGKPALPPGATDPTSPQSAPKVAPGSGQQPPPPTTGAPDRPKVAPGSGQPPPPRDFAPDPLGM